MTVSNVKESSPRKPLRQGQGRTGTRMPSSTLSAYELERKQNIASNHAKLVELGIEKLVSATPRSTIKGVGLNKRPKAEVTAPRHRSLRLQNLDAEGHALPDKEVKPSPTPEPSNKRARKSSAPLDAAKVSTGATSAEEATVFLQRLGTMEAPAAGAPTTRGRPSSKSGLVDTARTLPIAIALDDLAVADEDMAKLVPERIFSLEMHPSATKLLVAAGDTWGRVGLWDVGAGDDSPVATFQPHSRPVAGLRILATAPHMLLSCSHDGCVRALDLGGGASSEFIEIYRAAEDADGDYPTLHGLSRTAGEGGVVALSQYDGQVVLLDPRSPSSAARLAVHEKKVFSADFSPSHPWLLATGSLDRTVRLFDVRAAGRGNGKLAKPLQEMAHSLSVTSVRFSPAGGRLLTTCNDNLLRVFESIDGGWATYAPSAVCKHNNHTGRYITPFQAEWVRGSDDKFVCGSLEQPRGVDVFHSDGTVLDRLEDENVNSVSAASRVPHYS